jgi:hypothetical protein
MRVMARITMPVEPGNRAIKDGSLELSAEVELAPAMNGDDLQKGLSQIS